MKLRLTFGIFPKLLLTMLVVALTPLGAIWYLDYRTESESLSRQIEQRLSGQADTMVGYVDAWVDMNVRMLRQNAALDDMSSMDGKKQKPLLRAIAAEYKWVYLSFTIAPDGNNIGRNDEEAPRFYGDRGYFKQAIDGRQVGQEVVVSRTTGQPAAILSVPIWKLDKVVGVLAAGTSVTDVGTSHHQREDRAERVRLPRGRPGQGHRAPDHARQPQGSSRRRGAGRGAQEADRLRGRLGQAGHRRRREDEVRLDARRPAGLRGGLRAARPGQPQRADPARRHGALRASGLLRASPAG